MKFELNLNLDMNFDIIDVFMMKTGLDGEKKRKGRKAYAYLLIENVRTQNEWMNERN